MIIFLFIIIIYQFAWIDLYGRCFKMWLQILRDNVHRYRINRNFALHLLNFFFFHRRFECMIVEFPHESSKINVNKWNLPKIYGLYRSPLMYVSLRLLLFLIFFDLWLFSSISVKISGKHFKMLCLDVGIVLLFNSFTLTQIVGIGHFSSLAVGDVVTLLLTLIFFLKFGILFKLLLSTCYSNI